MEVPVINRITEFEPTHSFFSRLFSLFDRFWKWGALFLALLYAFTSVAYRIKFLIIHYHIQSKSLFAATETLLPNFDDDLSTDDEDERNDDVSSSSVSGEEEEEEDPISPSEDLTRFGQDFRVKGKFKIRRRRSIGDDFSLMDLVSGNGIVKLWDGSFPAVSLSPSVIFSAGSGDDGVLGLGLWDFRTSLGKPAVQAGWRFDRQDEVVGVDAGRTGKAYVRDERKRITIGDVRKFDTPLEKSTVSEKDDWWDADGGFVMAESTR